MKKIYTSLLTLPLLLFFFVSSAQSQRAKPFLSIGPEFSQDIREKYKIGIGGSLKFGVPVTRRSTITLSTGYTSFRGKWQKFQGMDGRNLHIASLPVRLGWRYNLNKNIYLEPQVGYSRIMFEKNWPDFGTLNYGLNIGVMRGKHWDISAQYQGFTKKSNFSFVSAPYESNMTFHTVGIRMAYNFSFKK